MMNQELTMRQRPQIKAFYVLLRYVITLLLDGTDKTQLVSALSVDEHMMIVSLILNKRRKAS